MGYNSVIFLCNDAWSDIDRDPAAWWGQTKQALQSRDCMRGQTEEYGFGSSANGFNAVYNDHADNYALIAVGGNHATVIDIDRGYGTPHWGHHDPEAQLAILRTAAEKLGHELRPLPKNRLEGAWDRFKRFGFSHVRERFLPLFQKFFEGRLEEAEKEEMRLVGLRLKEVALIFRREVNEVDLLPHPVTRHDIAKMLATEGVKVPPEAVELQTLIQEVGLYTVPVRLHPEVITNISVYVLPEEASND